jgi:type IV pilus assembly protein PilB
VLHEPSSTSPLLTGTPSSPGDAAAQHAPPAGVPGGPPPPRAPGPADPARPSGERRARAHKLIGDVVVELGFATREQVEAAVKDAQTAGVTTGSYMLQNGLLTHEQLARVVAERFGVEYIDLASYPVDMAAATLIDPHAARRYQAVPVGYTPDQRLLVAMADPANLLAIDDIAMLTNRKVRAGAASAQDIAALVNRLHRLETSTTEGEADLEPEMPEDETGLSESPTDAPVVKLVHSIIGGAIEDGASDIHFDPQESAMRVQLRVDGVLSSSTTIPRRVAPAVISRIKIMAGLDIAERRAPQDGRCRITLDARTVDLRVATLPLVRGESAVIRILDRGTAALDLSELGMLAGEQSRYETAIGSSHGAVMVTGPTGSGKSTTLYGALRQLNTGERNIVTIEDPVEYELSGIKQMQVNPKAGVTFATGLRSIMRADPDVIMIGEIRDRETAQIAIEAALTGHLVLSTLHTNDAPTAIARLTEMGIEPFLIASAIECVVAQRLVRVLCEACKRETEIPPTALWEHGTGESGPLTAFEPVGCGRCGGSGYRGRVGIYEVMPITPRIRDLVLARATAEALATTAVEEGMRRLRDDGLEKVRRGITSMAEVARVTTLT